MKHLITILTVLVIFSTVSVEAQKKKKEPELKQWNSYDFSKHFSIKFFGGKKEFRENKRVFVSDFAISQIVLANGKATGTASFAKMTVNMSPIDMKAYQDVAAKAYDEFIASLKSQGYQIVPDEEVASSKFAREENNGKSASFWYHDEDLLTDKDQFGNEMIKIRPKGKYTVTNTKVGSNWLSRFSKAIDANIISVNLIVNFVGFDGSRHTGYKGGPSVSGGPYLSVQPWLGGNNEKGGLMVSPTTVEGNNHWVGPNGMSQTSHSTTYLGAAKGKYIMDVNQDIYLAEVDAISRGLVKAFAISLWNEVK